MIRQVLRNLGEGEWFVLGFGGAVGVLWSVVPFVLVVDWCPNATWPLARRRKAGD